MFPKTLSKAFLIFLVVFGLLAAFGPKKSFAQTVPSPSPTPSCLVTHEGEMGPISDWVYAIGGGSRTGTGQVALLSSTDEICGYRDVSVTQDSYCGFMNDELQTIWVSGIPQSDMAPGQCENDQETATICFNGVTLEVEVGVLDQEQYQGYTNGVCSTPPPLVCGDNQHLDANGTECVSFSDPGDPGGGTTSTGQVLGASTLAATGDSTSEFGIILMALGSLMTLSSLYAFRKSSS
jgi:hypothetical protein